MPNCKRIDFDVNYCDDSKDTITKNGLSYNVITYGCAMNEHDSEQISGILEKMGFVKNETNADLVIFNTCCVRDNAENRLFGNVGALKEKKALNSNMIIGVCGCMMQQDSVAQDLKKRFPFVDVIFGTHNIQNLPSLISKAIKKEKVLEVFDSDGYIVEGLPVIRNNDYSAFINIMYGCNNYCTYCIVPFVRGKERSRNSKDIIEEAINLAKDGVTQITLLGQNVNSYNSGSDDLSFPKLLDKLCNIEGLKRINYLTSHPKDLSNELIDVIAMNEKISKHLHLPIQSGDSNVLKAMNRGYSREDYLKLVDNLKKSIPDIGITTDIIVGFPGETDEQFKNTLELMRRVEYDAVFSFMFNVRKGTAAQNMANQIPLDVKKNRLQELITLQKHINLNKNTKLIGKHFEVLIDKPAKTKGQLCGRSECGKLINVETSLDLIGKYVTVEILKGNNNSLFAKVVE